MSESQSTVKKPILKAGSALSTGAREEFDALLGPAGGDWIARIKGLDPVEGRSLIPKRPITVPDALNEAFDDAKLSSFSRGMHRRRGPHGLPGRFRRAVPADFLQSDSSAGSRGRQRGRHRPLEVRTPARVTS